MRSSKKRKRVGRPRAFERRPVLSARVPKEFHARILASAVISGRNISEELMWRAEQSYEWEKAHGTALAMLAKARGVADANNKASQEQALREWGYKPVRSFDGTAWFEPGVNAIQWIYASLGQENRSLLQEILHQAMRTVERMAAERAEQMRAQS